MKNKREGMGVSALHGYFWLTCALKARHMENSGIAPASGNVSRPKNSAAKRPCLPLVRLCPGGNFWQ